MLDEEVEVAKDAAREAGEVMDRFRREGFEVDRKDSYTDLVTEADHEAQREIIETVREEFPEDGFLTEEEGLKPDGEDRVWVIDPIDGTTNFVHGFPYYCVSIALREDGISKVGVVFAPALDELYHGVRGGGSFLNGDPISVSDISDVREGLVAAGGSSWASEETNDLQLGILRELVETPVSFRFPGASALEYCHLARGYFEGKLQVLSHPWDIAAGTLVLEEAGGETRVRESVVDGYTEVVASNGRQQEELERMFDRHVRHEG